MAAILVGLGLSVQGESPDVLVPVRWRVSDPTAHIEMVRRRPGMFVGSLDDEGLLALASEILGNAYDQYLMGRCTHIIVSVDAEGVITVEDDGPGIAADRVHALLTTPSHRPTVDGHRPHVHLQKSHVGVGLLAVNALCAWVEVATVHAGIETTARYEVARGGPLSTRPSTRAPGTRIRFLPEAAIFSGARLSRMSLMARVDELLYLSPGLRIDVRLDADDSNRHGLAALVARTAACDLADVAHGRALFEGDKPLDVEVAIAWAELGPRVIASPHIDSFVNLTRSPKHGTHVNGMLAGLARFKGGDHQAARKQLVAAVAVVLEDVHWGNPAKHTLMNRDVAPRVAAVTHDALVAWAARR